MKKITKSDYIKMIKDVKVLDDFIVFAGAAFHGELPAIHNSTRQRWRALEADPIKFQSAKEKEINYVLNRSKIDYVLTSDIQRRVERNKLYEQQFPDLSLLARREVIVS